MRLIAIILLTACLGINASARKKATTRKVSPRTETVDGQIAELLPDSIAATDDMLMIYGYDKPLQATKESLFVTNNTTHQLCEILLSITYYDTSGAQLHQAEQRIRADIPPGQTRKLEFRSWDTQRSFYYEKSRRPRSSAIPYKVTIKPEYVYFYGTSD
ncbi:MAG: FxLYD domain-containing protein [Muribaculaceae bacterium]|nr:FxLYD domain-containing protein [Muribaculaceae bacterium]